MSAKTGLRELIDVEMRKGSFELCSYQCCESIQAES